MGKGEGGDPQARPPAAEGFSRSSGVWSGLGGPGLVAGRRLETTVIVVNLPPPLPFPPCRRIVAAAVAVVGKRRCQPAPRAPVYFE